jgi:FkbM family methyltransferase
MLIDNFVNFVKSKGEYNVDVILDIGSRDLEQSIEFSSVYPNAKIYAFEPNPEQYKICADNAVNHPNIKTFNIAISDKKGTAQFYKTIGNIGASSLLEPISIPFAYTNEVHVINVETDTLENWLIENSVDKIDLMWMDTQGTELTALQNMGEHLKKVKFLHCEAAQQGYYKGHLLKDELEAFLIGMGFEIEFHESYHPFGEGDVFAVNKNI